MAWENNGAVDLAGDTAFGEDGFAFHGVVRRLGMDLPIEVVAVTAHFSSSSPYLRA